MLFFGFGLWHRTEDSLLDVAEKLKLLALQCIKLRGGWLRKNSWVNVSILIISLLEFDVKRKNVL
jgi:hypothetical protein